MESRNQRRLQQKQVQKFNKELSQANVRLARRINDLEVVLASNQAFILALEDEQKSLLSMLSHAGIQVDDRPEIEVLRACVKVGGVEGAAESILEAIRTGIEGKETAADPEPEPDDDDLEKWPMTCDDCKHKFKTDEYNTHCPECGAIYIPL